MSSSIILVWILENKSTSKIITFVTPVSNSGKERGEMEKWEQSEVALANWV